MRLCVLQARTGGLVVSQQKPSSSRSDDALHVATVDHASLSRGGGAVHASTACVCWQLPEYSSRFLHASSSLLHFPLLPLSYFRTLSTCVTLAKRTGHTAVFALFSFSLPGPLVTSYGTFYARPASPSLPCPRGGAGAQSVLSIAATHRGERQAFTVTPRLSPPPCEIPTRPAFCPILPYSVYCRTHAHARASTPADVAGPAPAAAID